MRRLAVGRMGCVALACLAPAMAPGTAVAASPEVSGSLRVSGFSSSRDLDDVQGIQALTGEVELKHDVGDIHRFEIKGRSTVFGHQDFDRTRTHWASVLWHARFEHADLRLGQQKIRWGKADGINPTDFFTPVDHAGILPLEDDRYLSVPAARVDVHFGEADSLSMVATHGFTPSTTPWPRPSPVPLREEEPGTSQLGARLSHTGERMDWSLSAFRGHATLPLLHDETGGATQAPRYLRHYAPIRGVGMDVARNLGAFGFRAELAYTDPRTDTGLQGIQSNWHLVAGIDRTLSEWNFNLQAVVRHTPDFEPVDAHAPASTQWAAQQNAILHGQQARWVHGMTARIVADWRNDTLQTELLAVAQFSPGNGLIRPLVTYALSDRTKIRVGADYYTGPEATLFGSLKRNRTAFVELQLYY